MMRIKKEYFVLIAIIVGLSAYLALHRTDQTHYTLPEIPALDGKAVTAIEINTPDQTLTLKKKDDAWRLDPQGFPADKDRVKGLIDILADLRLADLVSESENYVRYDLQEDKRIRVRAWEGDRLLRDLNIGRAAASFRHTFVKLEGDPNVYHARENFRSRFDTDIAGLRDKTALAFEKQDVNGIVITKGQTVLELVQQAVPVVVSDDAKAEAATGETPAKAAAAPVWQDAAGKTIDGNTVSQLLNSLYRLKCSGYVDGRDKTSFTEPIYTVQLNGPESRTLSVFARLNSDDETYPAISSQNDYAFLLNGTQAERFMNLFDPPAAAGQNKTTD